MRKERENMDDLTFCCWDIGTVLLAEWIPYQEKTHVKLDYIRILTDEVEDWRKIPEPLYPVTIRVLKVVHCWPRYRNRLVRTRNNRQLNKFIH